MINLLDFLIQERNFLLQILYFLPISGICISFFFKFKSQFIAFTFQKANHIGLDLLLTVLHLLTHYFLSLLCNYPLLFFAEMLGFCQLFLKFDLLFFVSPFFLVHTKTRLSFLQIWFPVWFSASLSNDNIVRLFYFFHWNTTNFRIL